MIALIRLDFVGKVMSLLFNMLSMLAILDTVRGTKMDGSVLGDSCG